MNLIPEGLQSGLFLRLELIQLDVIEQNSQRIPDLAELPAVTANLVENLSFEFRIG